MDAHDELDQLLDDALAEYKAPPPRPGLELRALAYVRSETSAQRGFWCRWALATAAVLALMAAGLMFRHHPGTPSQVAGQTQLGAGVPQAFTARQQVPSCCANAGRPGAARQSASPRVVAPHVTAAEPRLAVFPAPLPLTAEERMWISLARRAPETLTRLAREQRSIEPIVIPEIKIQALEESEQSSTGGKR